MRKRGMKKGKQKQQEVLKAGQRGEKGEREGQNNQKRRGRAAMDAPGFHEERNWQRNGGGGGKEGSRKASGSNKQKILGGHSRKRQKLEAGVQNGRDAESESDDGPEEVTMTQGRREVEKRRQEERESKRRLAAEAKRRRQQRFHKKEAEEENPEIASVAQLPDPEQDGASALGFPHPAEKAQLQTGNESHNVGRLLDDKIVQFLTAREQSQVHSSGNKPKVTALQSVKSQRSTTRLESEINGRVRLVLLKDLSPSQNQSALEFRQSRLFGSHISRSFSMLKKL